MLEHNNGAPFFFFFREAPWCQQAQMFWSTSTMLIRYSPLQWRDVSTGPRLWGVHADICSVSGARCGGDPTQGKAPFMLQHGGCYGYGLDSALSPRGLKRDRKQLALGRLKWCLGLSHTPQDPPHSAWSVVGAYVCTTSHQGEDEGEVCVRVCGRGGGARAYCRSWRKLFRGDSLPLNRENSINYLHWQMFTDPNMHEFVELAGFPQPNVLVFTMRAGAVVILAVLQRALIWAVSATNHFGGNYFTP